MELLEVVKYDLIVLGTGLEESLLARCFATTVVFTTS